MGKISSLGGICFYNEWQAGVSYVQYQYSTLKDLRMTRVIRWGKSLTINSDDILVGATQQSIFMGSWCSFVKLQPADLLPPRWSVLSPSPPFHILSVTSS